MVIYPDQPFAIKDVLYRRAVAGSHDWWQPQSKLNARCCRSIYHKIWPIWFTTSINWFSFQFVIIWNCMKIICSRFRWNWLKSNWPIISFYVQWKVNDFNMRSRNWVDLNLNLVFQDADSSRRPNCVSSNHTPTSFI